MALYPALFERYAEDEIVVSFCDLPECLTSGVDEIEALAEAQDALEAAIIGRIDDDQDIPLPSALQAGERYIEISLVDVLAAWRNLGCAICRSIDSREEFQKFMDAAESIPNSAAECNHSIIQNRDAVEARYRQAVHHIENEDYARRLRIVEPQST